MEFRQKAARLPRSAEEKVNWKRVIVILEHCPLQGVQTDKGFELLNERHRNHHARYKQDPAAWRPDVVHQCLLHLQDSALNRAGMLQVFLRTSKGVCIAVDPRLRVPRHMRLFDKMMTTLLFKMKVRASTGYLSLLRVVKNPITDHIPANCRFFRVEKDGDCIGDLYDFCARCGYDGQDAPHAPSSLAAASPKPSTLTGPEAGSSSFAAAQRENAEKKQFKPFAFVIGGMAKGDVEVDYAAKGVAESIRLGDRGMSAATVISMLLHGFEEEWLREDNEA